MTTRAMKRSEVVGLDEDSVDVLYVMVLLIAI